MRRADNDGASGMVREVVVQRGIVEALRLRGHLLTGKDRALLEMYLEHGNSFSQIARLAGVHRKRIARRIRRIVRRLIDDTYPACRGNHIDFNGRELAIIKDYFVHGLPMARISKGQGVTFYSVRATIRKARRYAVSRKRGIT